MCKGPQAHGGQGQRPRCVPQDTSGNEPGSLTPQPQTNPTDPWGLQQPESHPTVPRSGRTVSPGPESPPGTPGRRRVCVPIRWPAGSVKGAAGTRELPFHGHAAVGRDGGLQPRAPREPMQGAQHSMGMAGSSVHTLVCTHRCALPWTCRAALRGPGCTPGPQLPHSVPVRSGPGMHEDLGRRSPCWEVTRGVGATCRRARGGEGLTAPDVRATVQRQHQRSPVGLKVAKPTGLRLPRAGPVGPDLSMSGGVRPALVRGQQ